MEPVYSAFEESPSLVGFLVGVTNWHNLFDRLLPDSAHGVMVVLKDSCGHVMTYELNGALATYLGPEDFHDPAYDVYRRTTMNIELYEDANETIPGMCGHDLYIYPSAKFEASYATNSPAIYSSVIVLAFALMSVLLIVYDRLVTLRQDKTMQTAARTQAIVQSLFPKDVGKQIIQEAHEQAEERGLQGKAGLKSLMEDAAEKRYNSQVKTSKPIADLFPETTVMFAGESFLTQNLFVNK